MRDPANVSAVQATELWGLPACTIGSNSSVARKSNICSFSVASLLYPSSIGKRRKVWCISCILHLGFLSEPE